MSNGIPALEFDERDRDGVAAALAPFSDVISLDPWAFATGETQKRFAELLAKHQPMTDYLDGKPLDSVIADGVLHPIYRGVAVVFVLVAPSSNGGAVREVSSVQDVAVRPEQLVVAKFWISAAVLMPGRGE